MNTLSKSSQFPSLRNMMEDLWNPENWMGRPFSPAANLPAVNIRKLITGMMWKWLLPASRSRISRLM